MNKNTPSSRVTYSHGPHDSIGPYRMEGTIGKGGMGTVYKAYDTRLERFVALKRMHRSEAREQARLRREARAVAQLSHPNIVQIYDLLSHGEDDWIVMELVGGSSLRSMIQRQALDVPALLQIGLDITKGLAAAHARGIVHRDLKTDNVIVTSTGRAKILDFGLAELGTDIEGSLSGRIQGTPRTMAPEQAMGEKSTFRSDLFSLGVLLYECVLGRSPFAQPGKGLLAVLSAVCSYHPRPLHNIDENVPEELSDLVSRLMEKDPMSRPDGAEEVLVTLQRIQALPTSQEAVRVLFVDDEPDLQTLIRQWFSGSIRAGKLQASFAADGAEALDILQRDPSIQLVFTDLNMPKVSGMTLLREMQELNRTMIPVVMSAYSDMSNFRQGMQLGAFDFLTKPIDLQDLERTLEKAAEHLVKVREAERLRAENQLLDQRNRHIRDAWKTFLEGDASHHDVISPMIEDALGNIYACSFLVTLDIDGLAELADTLPGRQALQLSQELASRAVESARRHKGVLWSMDQGRIVVGFGLGPVRREDARRAGQFASDMRGVVDVLGHRSRSLGGPALEISLAIDARETPVVEPRHAATTLGRTEKAPAAEPKKIEPDGARTIDHKSPLSAVADSQEPAAVPKTESPKPARKGDQESKTLVEPFVPLSCFGTSTPIAFKGLLRTPDITGYH